MPSNILGRLAIGASLLVSLVVPAALAGQAAETAVTHAGHAPARAAGHGETLPLYDNLGDHHYGIGTDVPDAQRYFDQGLRLYYAFNHDEAVRSFREAQRLDPDCAMCWWGEALALGPNINMPMDSANGVAAHRAVTRALALSDGAGERERALIEALGRRYAPVPPAERAALDSAYARAMGALVERYPDDPEILVLHGESLMDLRPWDYWTPEGVLEEGIALALAGFEEVLREDASHPGACHFFIHAVEKEQPERAVPCAERLAGLMPGAGHIVHMPGHIYIRVGRYLDALEANRHAVHADESWIRDRGPGMSVYTAGYYPHNYDFLAFAASMVGRSGEALAAADRVAGLIPAEMLGAPGMSFLQHWWSRPLQVRIRFARWEEIAAAPAPRDGLPHARAMWHYARGRAFAATADPVGAARELEALERAAASPELDGVRMEFNESKALLAIAARVLRGWMAHAAGRSDEAVRELTEAARLEDGLLYGEPPEWTIPVRQDLGRALLAAGRPREAERVFREDLDRFPANGWSLAGLADALRGQGREEEARAVEAELLAAWREADVEPRTAGR